MKFDYSIVRPDRFIEATRDSGYKGTDSALSELIDNSIQAQAKSVTVEFITSEEPLGRPGKPRMPRVVEILVADNGRGMDAETLRRSLRFGDSSRFNDRAGIGRFGMGLPNASVNQCRRVEVYSWLRGCKALFTYVDVDLIARGELIDVPEPKEVDIPAPYSHLTAAPSGTLVVWKRCDRLDFDGRAETLTSSLRHSLGRMFRYFLAGDFTLSVNKQRVEPFDPLFLMKKARMKGDLLATQHGETMRFEVPIPNKPDQTSCVEVTISLLPDEWQMEYGGQGRNKEQKEWLKSRHIDDTAGFSIVRANREIDIISSPYHMSHWRDRWYRVEVRFDPELDEAFGVTHTKQHARIAPGSPMFNKMEAALKANMTTVRHIVDTRKPPKRSADRPSLAEEVNKRVEPRLKPIEAIADKSKTQVRAEIAAFVQERVALGATSPDAVEYLDRRLMEFPVLMELENLVGAPFFRVKTVGTAIIAMLNTAHPFFERVYRRLEEESPGAKTGIDLLLMSLARSEVSSSEEGQEWYESQRQEWSQNLKILTAQLPEYEARDSSVGAGAK